MREQELFEPRGAYRVYRDRDGRYAIDCKKDGSDSTHFYKDRPEAIAAWTALWLKKPCSICGEPELSTYIHQDELDRLQECFMCNFWMNIIRKAPEPGRLVIEGSCYFAYPFEEGVTHGWGRGYSGRTFHILKGEERVKTNNLWHQGTVPERFRSQLPDNARWADDDWNPRPIVPLHV